MLCKGLGCWEVMRNMKTKGWWISGLVCLVVLMMPNAIALTIATTANGDTHVTSSDCTIYLARPNPDTIRLDSDPDTVRVPMDISWFDERSASSPEIKHHFQMNTIYGGSGFSNFADRYTTGGMSYPGTGSFHMDVTGVAKSTDMWVHYSVTVSYTQNNTVLCTLDNSDDSPLITFHFN